VSCELVRVTGQVQGVCFRYYARHEAERLGINGWVKNLPDGSVEALICGSASQRDAMRAWLAHGPPAAEVRKVESRVWQGLPPSSGFHIAY